MKLDRAHQSAETQQAQQASGSQETHRHRHGHGGYAGGMHKGVAYRHAPRAQLPAKRNTGPAPRARPRPASTAAAGAHHEEEHPRSLADDPWAQGGGAGVGLMGGVGMGSDKSVGASAGRSGQRSSLTQQQDPSGAQPSADGPAPPTLPRQPPVQEGAALRRSRMPEAVLLRSPPREASPLSMAALLNAYASVYFHGADAPGATRPVPSPQASALASSPAQSTGSMAQGSGSRPNPFRSSPSASVAELRLAAKTALARHLGPDTPPVTLADIRASCVDWCQAHGRPPATTQAQRHANLLFPLDAFRTLSRPGAGRAGDGSDRAAHGASAGTPWASPSASTASTAINALLQRALEVHTAGKELSS